MNTLNQIMSRYDTGSVIVKSVNAINGTFIPIYHWRDYWIGCKPYKYNWYFLKFRKDDNPVWEVVRTREPFPDDHPIHEIIQNKIDELLEIINQGYRIGKQWENCRSRIQIKHDDYDSKNKILRKKKY
jgi:uncharacterized protein YqgV (UPF0045/DUF77 family)